MKRLCLCAVGLLFAFALAVPSRASACEKCDFIVVCGAGGADGCVREEICVSPQFGSISWADCEDFDGVCTTSGEICRWA